jgi:putative intracellular protease/amidase
MKKLILFLFVTFAAYSISAQHNAGNNGKILMIVSNPAVSKTTGWPIGVWYAELTHPYWIFSEAGYSVDIASLDGGEVKFDGFSDPEDESKYAAFDYISLGFKKDPAKMALLKNTMKLSTVDAGNYKAIFVCGGQGPMYTMYKNAEIGKFVSDFYQTGKPTAAICHGTCVLLDAKLSNGKYLVQGKRWTGFANSEENYADAYVGMKIQPFRIEDEARKMPESKFEVAHMFEAFAVRDGNLITGQQQNSGAKAAELVLKALEDDKQRYPTYVLVHGAWADESAWGFIRNELAVKANVVVVNLPAHGADNTYGAGIGLPDYVKTVTAAINKVNIMEVRDTKRGLEELTADIPNVSEEATKDLDENGLIRIGAEIKEGDILIGKITPKGETDPSPEEKLLRAIFGDKAGDVKDASLKAPPSTKGVVIDKKLFSRAVKDKKAKTNEKAILEQIDKEQDKELGTLKNELIDKMMLAVERPIQQRCLQQVQGGADQEGREVQRQGAPRHRLHHGGSHRVDRRQED